MFCCCNDWTSSTKMWNVQELSLFHIIICSFKVLVLCENVDTCEIHSEIWCLARYYSFLHGQWSWYLKYATFCNSATLSAGLTSMYLYLYLTSMYLKSVAFCNSVECVCRSDVDVAWQKPISDQVKLCSQSLSCWISIFGASPHYFGLSSSPFHNDIISLLSSKWLLPLLLS